MRKTIALLAAALAAMIVTSWQSPGAQARTPYDGLWSVSVITDSGTCDRGYRYALRIIDGHVTYDNPDVDVSGQVNPRGRVNVVVRYGGEVASGSGQLYRDWGEGRWIGRSATSECAGHWQAERRG